LEFVGCFEEEADWKLTLKARGLHMIAEMDEIPTEVLTEFERRVASIRAGNHLGIEEIKAKLAEIRRPPPSFAILSKKEKTKNAGRTCVRRTEGCFERLRTRRNALD
jgi:hypothetical protein